MHLYLVPFHLTLWSHMQQHYYEGEHGFLGQISRLTWRVEVCLVNCGTCSTLVAISMCCVPMQCTAVILSFVKGPLRYV